MRQIVEVKRLLENGCAEIFLERQSACSGDCHRCGGCGAIRQTVLAEAENSIGAKPGDRVVVESETGDVLLSAFLLYTLPLVLFFAGYFLGAAVFTLPGLWGGGGFLLGLAPALLRNRRLKQNVRFRITGFAQE